MRDADSPYEEEVCVDSPVLARPVARGCMAGVAPPYLRTEPELGADGTDSMEFGNFSTTCSSLRLNDRRDGNGELSSLLMGGLVQDVSLLFSDNVQNFAVGPLTETDLLLPLHSEVPVAAWEYCVA